MKPTTSRRPSNRTIAPGTTGPTSSLDLVQRPEKEMTTDFSNALALVRHQISETNELRGDVNKLGVATSLALRKAETARTKKAAGGSKAAVDDAKALSKKVSEIRQDIDAVLKDLETEMMCIVNGTSRPAFDLTNSKALLADIKVRYVEAKGVDTKPGPTAIRGRGGKSKTVRGGREKGVEGENSEVPGSGQMENLGATSEGTPEEKESGEIPGPAVKPTATMARAKPSEIPGTTSKGAVEGKVEGKELGEISGPAATWVHAKPTETPEATSEGAIEGKDLDNVPRPTIKPKSTHARAKPTEMRTSNAKTKRGRGSEDDEHAPQSNTTGKKARTVRAGPESDDPMGSDLTMDDSDPPSDEEHSTDPVLPPKDNESPATGHVGAPSSVTPPVAGVPGAVGDNNAAVTATAPTRGEHEDVEMLGTAAAPVTQTLQTTANLGSGHGSQRPTFAVEHAADDGVVSNTAGKGTKKELNTDSDGETQETTADDAPDDTKEDASDSDHDGDNDNDSDSDNDNDNDSDNDSDSDSDNDSDDDSDDDSDPTRGAHEPRGRTREAAIPSDDDASDAQMQLAGPADLDDLDEHAASHKAIFKKETKKEAIRPSNQAKTKGVSKNPKRAPLRAKWDAMSEEEQDKKQEAAKQEVHAFLRNPSVHRIPVKTRAMIREIAEFCVPACQTTRELALHVLENKYRNLFCIFHQRLDKAGRIHDRSGRTPFLVTGTPFSRLANEKPKKHHPTQPLVKRRPGYMHCGCTEDEALLEFYWWKLAEATSPATGETEGWLDHRKMDPRTRTLMFSFFTAWTHMETDDIYVGYPIKGSFDARMKRYDQKIARLQAAKAEEKREEEKRVKKEEAKRIKQEQKAAAKEEERKKAKRTKLRSTL